MLLRDKSCELFHALKAARTRRGRKHISNRQGFLSLCRSMLGATFWRERHTHEHRSISFCCEPCSAKHLLSSACVASMIRPLLDFLILPHSSSSSSSYALQLLLLLPPDNVFCYYFEGPWKQDTVMLVVTLSK